MDIALREAIVATIRADPASASVITSIALDPDGTGTITYNLAGVWIDPRAPGFRGGTRAITDEEVVRAYLLWRLAGRYRYASRPDILEVEHVYDPVGRPGKGGRIDVLVRRPVVPPTTPPGRAAVVGPPARGDSFLFIECKSPSEYDADFRLIDGQLFRLSLQEVPRPRYVVYYTVEIRDGRLRERVLLVDTRTFVAYADWDRAGQPITDAIPEAYGAPAKKRYANVADETDRNKPLDHEVTSDTFSRLRGELHDVIWGGGGTNNNDVFVYITKLILCKIYDEKETLPGSEYRFQRRGDAVTPEPAVELTDRMNDLYREAERAYLALPTPGIGPAFDPSRISPEKVAYVVGRLEAISVTENTDSGDLLGEFFEQIVSQDFTQTRGQFFTPIKLVHFMLSLSRAVERARTTMVRDRDHLGRPRLPYLIDPSAGSGTFLIQYMKALRRAIGGPDTAAGLPARVREAHQVWFGGATGMTWARDHLFAIENNIDLGLAAKVNMVLHGDGSMNTWIMNGLLPFGSYWVNGRTNILGVTTPPIAHPYGAPRNEQFDLVMSNPPFSIDITPDEAEAVSRAFAALTAAGSEALFLERWYQLLREGGQFCCIVPEALLDTDRNAQVRRFLLQHFRIEAVVSLPYDAFRPFTSTKTCILLATKRTAAEVEAFREGSTAWERENRGHPEHGGIRTVLDRLGWGEDYIFMAEPPSAGYKRRKGLPDLQVRNDLYQEDSGGAIGDVTPAAPASVLDHFSAGPAGAAPSPTLGFWTTLSQVARRPGLRLDPKYRWLWDFQDGLAHGRRAQSVQLRTFVDLVDLPKVKKGDLAEEERLVDLDSVKPRMGVLREPLPVVDVIGSEKIRFEGCDLAISKLEPYLGKVIRPPQGALGSTEWVGLRIRARLSPVVVQFLLMLPEMCDAYRRLQSGKRHARLIPEEFLDLRVELPGANEMRRLRTTVPSRHAQIQAARNRARTIRESIDDLYSVAGAETVAEAVAAELLPDVAEVPGEA